MNSIYAVGCSSSLLGAVSSSTLLFVSVISAFHYTQPIEWHITFLRTAAIKRRILPWLKYPAMHPTAQRYIAWRLQPGENVFINRIYRNNKPLIKCFINKPSYSCCCCCRRMYYHLGLVNESEPTPPSHITCSTKDTRRVATYRDGGGERLDGHRAIYKYAR